MIQENELRIGNVITHQNNNGIYLVTVLETLKKGVKVKTGMQLGEWFLRYEEVKGTPLTEEWLLKFGFSVEKKQSVSIFKVYELGIFTYNTSHKCFWINNSCRFFKEPKYVHQLQNLYFALTGSELVLSTVPFSIMS